MSTPQLDLLLQLRTVIARYGEKDALGWWDDESLTDSGAFVMNRLFPRTAGYVQIETAVEAATLRHQTLVPQYSRVTLFGLSALLESALLQRLLDLERQQHDRSLLDLVDRIDVGDPLGDTLLNLDLVTQTDLELKGAKPEDRRLHLGTLESDWLEANGKESSVIRKLAAGYTLSSKGNLVVPFYELGPSGR